jgi:hypothetical protein
MKLNASPSGSVPCASLTAIAIDEPSRSSIFARRPPQKAGESKNTVLDTFEILAAAVGLRARDDDEVAVRVQI